MPKPITDAVVRAIQRNLVEFGYKVDFATVKEAVDFITKGSDDVDHANAMGADIIVKFAHRMLEENGYLPDPAAPATGGK